MIQKSIGIFALLASCIMSCSNSEKEPTQVPQEETNNQHLTQVDTAQIPSATVEEMNEKKRILEKLVGEHKLISVSGSSGANSMIDFYREKGKWKISASANFDGMREGYDPEISKEDRAKLETMKIVVAPDLTLTLQCDNKTYFTVPFRKEGMAYDLKKAPKDFILNIPKDLKPSTTVLNSELYLLAKDECTDAEVSYLNLAQVMVDAVLITYNLETRQFNMRLFYAGCCDNSTYTFQ
ncbi:MAG: hypothetical protein RL092_1097 [Bacteroidota bacterium]|jgi:hypothetical protein